MLDSAYDTWKLATPPNYCDDDSPPDAAITGRMLDAGYDWDGEHFVRVLRRVVRTARRDHHGIKAGQRYREITTIYVDEDGKSERCRGYQVLGVWAEVPRG
jgi:hypothetical protein